MKKLMMVLGVLVASMTVNGAMAAITLPTTLTNMRPGSAGPNVPMVPCALFFGVSQTGCQAVNTVTVNTDGTMNMRVGNGVTVFSTTISMTCTGQAAGTQTWPISVQANAGKTSSVYDISVTIANGGTWVIDPSAYNIDVSYNLPQGIMTTTIFQVAATGGTETVVVYPTGVTKAVFCQQDASVTGSGFIAGTVSGRAAKGEGMLVSKQGNPTYVEDGGAAGLGGMAYSATGTSRYVDGAGNITEQVSVATFVEPIVCISDISMAKAKAGVGQILRRGQVWHIGPRQPFTQTMYACILNYWVPGLPTVSLSVSSNSK